MFQLERAQRLRCRFHDAPAAAGQAWDLRCEVGEKLVDFLQRVHPEARPRVRVASSEGWPHARPDGIAAAAAGARAELPTGGARR